MGSYRSSVPCQPVTDLAEWTDPITGDAYQCGSPTDGVPLVCDGDNNLRGAPEHAMVADQVTVAASGFGPILWTDLLNVGDPEVTMASVDFSIVNPSCRFMKVQMQPGMHCQVDLLDGDESHIFLRASILTNGAIEGPTAWSTHQRHEMEGETFRSPVIVTVDIENFGEARTLTIPPLGTLNCTMNAIGQILNWDNVSVLWSYRTHAKYIGITMSN